jgi:transcriptional regulator with XRE-family HTH domain
MAKSPTSVRARQIGAMLKQSRRVAGMTGEFVAGKLDVSISKISRLESGQRNPKVEDVIGLLTLYGITGRTREEIVQLCHEAATGETGWWQRREMSQKQRTLIELESTATRIINYEPLLVPGLLHTGEYAHAVFRDIHSVPKAEIEDRMVTRLARQSVLMRKHPPRLLAIVDERALRIPVGDTEVLQRQLHQLFRAVQQEHISLRIVPECTCVHPGLGGPFAKLEFADAPPVVFLESRMSSLFLEDKEEISGHDAVLEQLLTVALSAGESAQLLANLANDHRQGAQEETADGSTDGESPLMA